MRVSSSMTWCQNIYHPLQGYLSVFLFYHIIKACIVIIMHGHKNYVIHLNMSWSIWEIMIIICFELLMRVFNKPEALTLYTSNTKIYWTCSSCLIQLFQSSFNGICKLNYISYSIHPWFSNPCLILFYRVLFSNFFTYSNSLTKSSNGPNKSSKSNIGKRMRPFLC